MRVCDLLLTFRRSIHVMLNDVIHSASNFKGAFVYGVVWHTDHYQLLSTQLP